MILVLIFPPTPAAAALCDDAWQRALIGDGGSNGGNRETRRGESVSRVKGSESVPALSNPLETRMSRCRQARQDRDADPRLRTRPTARRTRLPSGSSGRSPIAAPLFRSDNVAARRVARPIRGSGTPCCAEHVGEFRPQPRLIASKSGSAPETPARSIDDVDSVRRLALEKLDDDGIAHANAAVDAGVLARFAPVPWM